MDFPILEQNEKTTNKLEHRVNLVYAYALCKLGKLDFCYFIVEMEDLKITRRWTPPIHPEECVSGSNPGAGTLQCNTMLCLMWFSFCNTLSFSQRVSMVILTCSPTYSDIFPCFSFGITTSRISPILDIFATYCSTTVIIGRITCITLKNGYSQIYYTIFIYCNIWKYSLDSHSRHNKGGG